jgi:hypothetical protein
MAAAPVHEHQQRPAGGAAARNNRGLSHDAAHVPAPQLEVHDPRAMRGESPPREGIAGHAQAEDGEG